MKDIIIEGTKLTFIEHSIQQQQKIKYMEHSLEKAIY